MRQNRAQIRHTKKHHKANSKLNTFTIQEYYRTTTTSEMISKLWLVARGFGRALPPGFCGTQMCW